MNMLVSPTRQYDKLAHQPKEKRKSRFYNKTVNFANLEPKSSPFKKNNLNSLVEKVSLNFVEDMVSSPRKRKNSQKHFETLSMKCSTHHSQSSPRESVEKVKTYDIQRRAEQLRKQSLNAVQNAQQYFQIKIDQIKVNSKDCGQTDGNRKNSQQSFENLNFYPKMTKSKSETVQVSEDEHKINQNHQNHQYIVETENHQKKENIQPTTKKFQKTSILSSRDFNEIKLLGVGVYGRVCLAKHKKTNMLVALKKIQKNTLNVDDSIYLSREIKIQNFAEHPNIVQLYTFFDDQEDIYLVLEVCNQGNLYDILQKKGGKFTEEMAKKYIKQICMAIQFLHNHEIIHRDLKPENILVHNGVAKICDFGWSIHMPELKHTQCGTPLYSSPEIIKQQRYDHKIDIWSIGVITYEFIYGHVPFDIKSCQDLQKVVNSEIIFPQNDTTSQNCRDFIRGCLQKNPLKRLEIWQALRHPFINMQEKLEESLMNTDTNEQD